jgi:hypothetical protein
MGNDTLLAYCGLYCGGCANFAGNAGEFSCQGCRVEPDLVADCPTKACAAGKGILHCGQCASFPCPELDQFYTDGIRHHALAQANVERIKLIGPEQWLAEKGKEHACICGKRRLWFADKCTHGHP